MSSLAGRLKPRGLYLRDVMSYLAAVVIVLGLNIAINSMVLFLPPMLRSLAPKMIGSDAVGITSMIALGMLAGALAGIAIALLWPSRPLIVLTGVLVLGYYWFEIGTLFGPNHFVYKTSFFWANAIINMASFIITYLAMQRRQKMKLKNAVGK